MARRRKRNRSALESLVDAPATATLVHGGHEFFDVLLRMIGDAREELHLQTYIFDHDETGKEVIAALLAAVKRGVRVVVLIDAFGSGGLPQKVVTAMQEAGIEIRLFGPWLSWQSLHLGRRLHHKVVVVDRKSALIGGINIADKYKGTNTERAWLDFAVQLESEPIGNTLAQLCESLFVKRHFFLRKRVSARMVHSGDVVTILLNDYLLGKIDIQRAYRKAVSSAKKDLTIIGTYFLPGALLSYSLQQAAKRGVKVRLVLSGTSDVPTVKRATDHLYGKLLRNGLLLFEWPHSVLHGKAAVRDGEWTTIGSYNLNQLSAYGSIEMNVAIQSPQFAKVTTTAFDEVIAECTPITAETYQQRAVWHQRLLNWACYHLIRLSFTLLTYTSYKRLWSPRRESRWSKRGENM
jgi:cardiolipin synthase